MLTIIADKLSAAGWSWAIAGTVTRNGWRWLSAITEDATFSVGVHEEIRSFGAPGDRRSHDGGDAIFWATGLYKSLYTI